MEVASSVRLARLLVSICLGMMCCHEDDIHIENKLQYFPGTKDTLSFQQFYNGKEHGRWVKYYSPHQLQEERFFDMGRKVDTLKIWWENGQLQALFPFDTDEYQGECTEWNSHGQMIRRMHYQRGHEEGAQQQWYDDGSVRSNYVIHQGRRYGLLGTKNCVNVSDSLAQ